MREDGGFDEEEDEEAGEPHDDSVERFVEFARWRLRSKISAEALVALLQGIREASLDFRGVQAAPDLALGALVYVHRVPCGAALKVLDLAKDNPGQALAAS